MSETSLDKQQSWSRKKVADLPNPLTEPQRMQAWIKAENQKLRKGLAGIQLNPQEVEFAMELQQMWGVFFLKVQDMVSGSVGQLAMKVGAEANRILEMIRTGIEEEEGPDGESIKTRLSFEQKMLLRKHFIELSEQARQMMADMQRGASMKEALNLKRKEIESGSGPRGKPGFGQLRSMREAEIVVPQPEPELRVPELTQ